MKDFGGLLCMHFILLIVLIDWKVVAALRILLGAFEAGFSPGVAYYLTWFVARRFTVRCRLNGPPSAGINVMRSVSDSPYFILR